MPIFAGTEILLNSTFPLDQYLATLTVLADGQIVAAWSDESGSGAVFGRVFSPDGLAATPQFLVNATTASIQTSVALAALPDGRFIATWTDFSGTPPETDTGVRARIFNADFTGSVPEFLVNSTTQGSQDGSEITVLTNGNILITWTDASQSEGDASNAAVRGRIFDADGVQVVPEFLVNATTNQRQENGDVTALADGGFVAVYTDFSLTGGDASQAAVRARIFNANGGQSVAEFRVNTSTFSAQTDASVEQLPDGRLVFVWRDFSGAAGDPSGSAIRARIFNANGTESVPEFVVNTTVTADQSQPSLAVLADGRFVVTWADYSALAGDLSFAGIRGRVFNADGTEAIPEFLVNATTNQSQIGGTVVALPDGRFMVSWTDGSQTGEDESGLAVRGRIFDPTVFSGTSIGERATGGSLGDRHYGLGGADTLTGNGGQDYLSGGDGNDQLYGGTDADTLIGGANDDTLNGGSGVDTMNGGLGNDIYFVDSAADVIIESSGLGTADRVAASVSFVLAADDNIEILTTTSSGGTTTINLTGNAVQQSITGNAGANVLSDGGGAGADTLTGLGGNDTYILRNAGTVIVEGAGQGVADRVAAGVSFVLAADDSIEVLTTSSAGATVAINLTGNTLAQTLTGNAGANVLDGRGGNDTMTGGAGADSFQFSTSLTANTDTITDFNVAADTIRLENTMFTGLLNGTLTSAAFRTNTTGLAGDGSDRIIYDSTTGNLYFDADGTGATARVQFAVLDSGLSLTNLDFLVF